MKDIWNENEWLKLAKKKYKLHGFTVIFFECFFAIFDGQKLLYFYSSFSTPIFPFIFILKIYSFFYILFTRKYSFLFFLKSFENLKNIFFLFCRSKRTKRCHGNNTFLFCFDLIGWIFSEKVATSSFRCVFLEHSFLFIVIYNILLK